LQIIDLRQAIVNRVHDNTKEELTEVIVDSVDHDEKALPGLGVLFEMIWKESSSAEQSQMIDSLHRHLHQSEGGNPSPS